MTNLIICIILTDSTKVKKIKDKERYSTYSTHEGDENCIQNFIRENKKAEIFKKICEDVDWIPLYQDCPRMGF